MTNEEERVPRVGEVIGEHLAGELPADRLPKPMPCAAGAATDDPCPRPATVWIDRETKWASCDEHARVHDLFDEANEANLAVEIATNWRDIARAWKLEDLERKTERVLQELKEESLRAGARADLAREMADAPRKGDENPTLTREQDEQLRHLIRRSDALFNAYTTIEDIPEGRIEADARRPILAVLVEESDRATKEAHRYQEELGLKDYPREHAGPGPILGPRPVLVPNAYQRTPRKSLGYDM